MVVKSKAVSIGVEFDKRMKESCFCLNQDDHEERVTGIKTNATHNRHVLPTTVMP